MDTLKTITVEELRKKLLNELNALPDDARVYFGNGNLSLYRPKHRGPVNGPVLLQIEFNEVYRLTSED
jgi:hypothetical protein